MYQIIKFKRRVHTEYHFMMEIGFDDGYFQEHYVVYFNYNKVKNVVYYDSGILVNGKISNISLAKFDELRKYIKKYMSLK
jgi:hypothetical protein